MELTHLMGEDQIKLTQFSTRCYLLISGSVSSFSGSVFQFQLFPPHNSFHGPDRPKTVRESHFNKL